MDAKNALRAPLKPILDLLDRRVLNLAKLIDAKSDELQKPLSQFAQFAEAAAAAQEAQTNTAQAVQALIAQNGSAVQPVLAGLGDVRQELAGIEQRVNQQLGGLTRTTLGTQESYLESLSYVGRALREIRDEIDQTSDETDALGTRVTSALDRFAAQLAQLSTREAVAAQIATLQLDLRSLRAAIDAAAVVAREDVGALRAAVDAAPAVTLDDIGALRAAIDAALAGTRDDMAALRAAIETVPASARDAVAPFWTRLATGAPADLDAASSAFLYYATGHRGFAAQAGLWVNHPVQIAHEPGTVRFDNVNERIVEAPFVFGAVAALPAGARVLDVGGTESTVALSLASLGYSVTVIDPRGYPFAHPSLRVVTTTLETWDEPPASYDAIVCLSTIEHIGLGAYNNPRLPGDADRAAMNHLRSLARPGAILALTVPFGHRSQDDFQRTYDRPALEALLGDWHVTSMAIAEQQTPQVWAPVGIDEPVGASRRVALVIASAT
jgi:hypothetical protein